jgi:hypothetical protein
MKQDLNSPTPDPSKRIAAKTSIDEAHEDLDEFNATKKTVTDLLNYKRALSEMGEQDAEKILEIKRRAMEAINHLFNDIVAPRQV